MHIHIYISVEDAAFGIEVEPAHVHAHHEGDISSNVIEQTYTVNAGE